MLSSPGSLSVAVAPAGVRAGCNQCRVQSLVLGFWPAWLVATLLHTVGTVGLRTSTWTLLSLSVTCLDISGHHYLRPNDNKNGGYNGVARDQVRAQHWRLRISQQCCHHQFSAATTPGTSAEQLPAVGEFTSPALSFIRNSFLKNPTKGFVEMSKYWGSDIATTSHL